MSAEKGSTRREFLTGQSALDAVANLGPPEDAAPAHRTKSASGYVVQIGRRAMACEFQVILNAHSDGSATDAAIEALDLVEALEAQMTWFREESELSRLNREAAQRETAVETRLFGLLCTAIDLWQETGGAFDITASPLWKQWGFFKREGRLPSDAELSGTLEHVGSQWLELNKDRRSLRYLHPKLEINLASIGKGYALDRCAEVLDGTVEDYLIHGGQSSILANGSATSSPTDQPGWMVTLRHPLHPTVILGEIRLLDEALGTSGSANQFFHFAGRRFGHILDPRTGWPPEATLSTTVLATTAAEADALATAFFVMSTEEREAYCDDNEHIRAIVILPGERSGSIAIETYGDVSHVWQPAS